MTATENIERTTSSPSKDAACSVVPVQREVINDQLLVALDDKSKVAIISSENDLTLMIDALRTTISVSDNSRNNRDRQRMLDDLRQLKQSAFG